MSFTEDKVVRIDNAIPRQTPRVRHHVIFPANDRFARRQKNSISFSSRSGLAAFYQKTCLFARTTKLVAKTDFIVPANGAAVNEQGLKTSRRLTIGACMIGGTAIAMLDDESSPPPKVRLR